MKKRANYTTLLGLSLIALAVALCYSNTLSAPLEFDDTRSIAMSRIGIPSFRAFSFLTLHLNYRIGGMEVAGYHLFNILVHLFASISVYYLARTLLKLKLPDEAFSSWLACGNFTAFFTALIFAVHPVQTQAVTYIVQRMASMAALFYVLTILLYLQGRIRENDGKRCYPWLIGSFVAAVCAVKSKEIAITLPLMVLLCEFTFFKSSAKTVIKNLAPFAIAALLVPLDLFFMYNSGAEDGFIDKLGKATAETADITRAQYLFTQFRVIATYLRLLILPINQNIDYDYAVSYTLFSPIDILALSLHLSLLTAAFFLITRNRQKSGVDFLLALAGFGIFWFYLALSVESGLIPIRDVIYEHRLYLPSFGAILTSVSLTAYLMEQGRARQKFIPAVTVAVISFVTIGYAVACYKRNDLWGSGLKLWEDALKKSPNKARVHHAVGFFKGEAGMSEEAILYFKKALELYPAYNDARVNLATAYRNLGRFEEALKELELVVNSAPGTQDAVNLLGLTYMKLDRNQDAIRVLTDASTSNVRDPAILNTTGMVYANTGDFKSAEEYFEKALALKPDFPEILNNLARLYEKFGHIDKGILAARRLAELDKNSHEAANLLGAFYLKRGDWGLARTQFEKAVTLAPENSKYKKNLEICNTLLIDKVMKDMTRKGRPLPH